MAIYIWLHSTPVGLIGIPKLPDATWPTAQRTGLGLSITLYALSSDIPWCPLWKRNRELSVAENRVAQILGGGGEDKKPRKALKKMGYFILFPPAPSSTVSACSSPDFSASWVPGGPIEPRTAQGVAAV